MNSRWSADHGNEEATQDRGAGFQARGSTAFAADNPTRSKVSIARELGIDPKALYPWIKEAKLHNERVFLGHGNPTDEVVVLRREVKLVTQERDILKNVIGIFSQRPR